MAWWMIGTQHLGRKMEETRNVLNRTHFRRNDGHTGWQWFWTTRANNGQITAVGGEGYNQLASAVNGFFSTHGVDPENASLSSTFSKLEKFADDHYVITQFDSVSATTE